MRFIPENISGVSESGVHNADHIRTSRQTGAYSVLIGEALMKADDKQAMLAELRGNYDKDKNVRPPDGVRY